MPDKQYLFSNDTLHYFTYDDIFDMYENGMSVSLITHKLSRVLGLPVTTCRTAVYSAITAHMLPVAPPYSACTAFLCDNHDSHSSPDNPDSYTRAPVPSPFATSWAVGDLCTRRY